MKMLGWALVAGLVVGSGCSPADTDTIVCYGRENNSGTYMYFQEHVLEKADFGSMVQTLPGTGQVISAVSRDQRSIGYGGIAYAKGVKALPVKKDAASLAVEPTQDAVIKGTYPISRYLYFYTVGEPEGTIKHFIEWVRSPEGQKVCSDVGYFALPEAQQGKAPTGTPAKETFSMKGSDTMVILGARWVERYMQSNPDVKIGITGGGSGTGIKALLDGETNICQSSRPMKPKEKEDIKAKRGKEPVEISVALDGLAIFVHEANPIKEISLEQLKGIYTGKITKWSALGGPAH